MIFGLIRLSGGNEGLSIHSCTAYDKKGVHENLKSN